MRTPSELYRKTPTIYKSELEDCPQCEHELVEMNYLSGIKTVQTMAHALIPVLTPFVKFPFVPGPPELQTAGFTDLHWPGGISCAISC